MRRFLAYIVIALSAIVAFGQQPSDSVEVKFRIGQSLFEPMLGDNRAKMDAFIEKMRSQGVENIERVDVYAFASPDGTNKINDRLSVLRCDVIARYIVNHTGISMDKVCKYPGGSAWDELRRLVAKNPDVPHRDEVLNLLDNTPILIYNAQGQVVSDRKRELMRLAGGVPYRWLFRNIFPELRSAMAVTFYLKSEEQPVELVNTSNTSEISEKSEPSDTIAPAEAIVPEEVIETTEIIEVVEPSENSELLENSELTEPSEISKISEEQPGPKRQRFALKTNIPYYAALMPNLEFEWLINDNWSVAIDGDVAWWSKAAQHKYYELAVVSLEGKYWIKPKAPWHGMYVGAFVGTGKYDFENGGLGYQGEGEMAGVSFGYMWPISKYFSFEAGIGAGYMHTQYKEYEPRDGHYIYDRTKAMNYFGPLKVKFSIVWRFNNINYTKKQGNSVK